MQVIEWNGIPLTGISHDEVSRIISNQIADEIEVVIRTDINLLMPQNQYGLYNMGPPHPMYGPGHGQAPGPVLGQGQGPGPAMYQHGGSYNFESSYDPNTCHPPAQPPESGFYQHQPPQTVLPSMVSYNGPNNYLTNPLNPHPYPLTKSVGQQPQVILQHNHPINENLAYNQFGNQNRAPLNPMMPPPPSGVGPGIMPGPAPGQMQPPPPSTHPHGHPGPPPPSMAMMHRPSGPHPSSQPSGPIPPPQ